MKTIKLLSYGSVILGATMLLSGCADKLNLDNPNENTEATFWSSESDFEKAITACYPPLKNWESGYYGTRGVMLRLLRSDEVTLRKDVDELYQVQNFTNTTSNGQVQNMFYQMSSCIYRTGTVLQKLEEKKNILSSDFTKRLQGEAHFLRGFILFQYGKEFKDAPMRMNPSQDPADFPLAKSSQAEIWAQAIKDLQEAADILPLTATAKGKPTKGAALMTIGKIYIYLKDWDKAISYLEPLTKSPYTYKLIDDYQLNFTERGSFNEESIFEIIHDNSGGTNTWSWENMDSRQSTSRAKEFAAAEVTGWYEATITDQMMDIFKQELDKDGNFDYRARVSAAWDYPGCMYYLRPFQEVLSAENQKKAWVLKYQNWDIVEAEDGDYDARSKINDRALRYGDLILLLAEAYMNKGNLDQAISYINQIRRRANLNDYSGPTTKEGVFADLEHQRAIELFVEGERFYDLRRWGLLEERLKSCSTSRYNQYITGKKGDINKYDYYPIPSKEVETNKLCSQNEGW